MVTYRDRVVLKPTVGVCWSYLDLENLKFNVDGSVRGKTGQVGFGGVLRNNKREVLGIFFRPLDVLSSNVVEVMAIKTAFELFSSSHWMRDKSLIIESNSLVALPWIGNRNSGL
ncbi:hypothetical protein REPUB_Repub02eG0120400 [Reevesia pubescens]